MEATAVRVWGVGSRVSRQELQGQDGQRQEADSGNGYRNTHWVRLQAGPEAEGKVEYTGKPQSPNKGQRQSPGFCQSSGREHGKQQSPNKGQRHKAKSNNKARFKHVPGSTGTEAEMESRRAKGQ